MSVGTTRRAQFKQADATRALRAAQRAGLRPSGYRIEPSGAILVILSESPLAGDAGNNPWDAELPA